MEDKNKFYKSNASNGYWAKRDNPNQPREKCSECGKQTGVCYVSANYCKKCGNQESKTWPFYR